MTETVTITPQGGLDANDDPIAAGTPFTLAALVAADDSTIAPGADGSLDRIAYTVYLPLKIKGRTGWITTISAMTSNFTITVRGNVCVGRVKEHRLNGVGGLEVKAIAQTGATP